jgi:hypothetical protein
MSPECRTSPQHRPSRILIRAFSPSCLAYLSLPFLLLSCGEKTDPDQSLRTERQLAATQAALQQQADHFERQSRDLERQLAALEKAVQAKETADLKERISAIRIENERLLLAAAEARQRSNDLASEFSRAPHSQPPKANNPATNPEPSLASFRRDLASQGTWLDVREYGSVWQPTVSSNLAWRPYVDGSWAWSLHGWTWSSNETFGQICYHYGRWLQLPRQGWVWVPGTEWAPAWVSWRTGKDCIGWAPLPPGPKRRTTTINSNCDDEFRIPPGAYCFVSTRQFVRSSYTSCLMTPVQVSQLFRHTTNITQIVLVNTSHHPIHIHHGGPDRQRIEEVCRLPIRELAPPRATLASNPSQSQPRALNTPANPLFQTPSRLPTPAIITESVDSPALNRRLPEASSQDVVITATPTQPPHEQQRLPNSSPTAQRPTLIHPLEVPTRNLLTSADAESTSPLPIQIARPEAEPIHFPSDRTQAPAPQPMESPPLAQSLRPTDLPQQQQIAPTLAASGMNLEGSQHGEGETNLQAQIAAQTARQDLERQTAEQVQQAQETASRADLARQQQFAMEAARQAKEAATRAEQERQQQSAAMEAESQRQAQEAAIRAEQERQQQLAAMEAENQRQAQEAAMRAEQERQQQMAAMEAESQRQAQEAAMRAEQERQQQMAAMEAERQRQAQEAAMRAEQERQQQMAAMEAERQRQAQEAAMRAEQERQQQMAAMEAERQRQAQEAAMRAEQERQQQMAAMEAERQRQAQEAAMRAEQERQQQMAAMEAERQRQAQEAAMRAEQERQQQMAAIEAERQRQAQEAAMRAEQERQQQALIEAERQRQMENRPSQE